MLRPLLVSFALAAPAAAWASEPARETRAGRAEAGTPFAITYRAGPKWRPGVPMRQQGLREHYFYVKRLHEDGRIIAAGELGPDGGLVLIRARDQAEADGLIAADPAVTAGLFTGEARPFVPRFVGAAPLSPVAP